MILLILKSLSMITTHPCAFLLPSGNLADLLVMPGTKVLVQEPNVCSSDSEGLSMSALGSGASGVSSVMSLLDVFFFFQGVVWTFIIFTFELGWWLPGEAEPSTLLSDFWGLMSS